MRKWNERYGADGKGYVWRENTPEPALGEVIVKGTPWTAEEVPVSVDGADCIIWDWSKNSSQAKTNCDLQHLEGQRLELRLMDPVTGELLYAAQVALKKVMPVSSKKGPPQEWNLSFYETLEWNYPKIWNTWKKIEARANVRVHRCTPHKQPVVVQFRLPHRPGPLPAYQVHNPVPCFCFLPDSAMVFAEL